MPPMKFFLAGAALVGALTSLTASQAIAQNAIAFAAPAGEGTPLPDAPEPASSSDAAQTSISQPTTPIPDAHQTKRILGIIPNFRAVSTDVKLPAQSPKEKVTTALQDSFDYSAFIFVGIQAGISQATDAYPAFHQGAAGFGRYYWHTFADQADENLLVEGLLPIAFHQDSRYYTKGHGGVLKRTAYSFSRTLITRNDDGNDTFNFSEVVGAGGAAGISSLYYPGQYRTWTKVGQRWLTSVLIDGGTFVAKEFWPDINSAVFHQKD
jgi:hypothetical protein